MKTESLTGQQLIDFIVENKMQNAGILITSSCNGYVKCFGVNKVTIECTDLNIFLDIGEIDDFTDNEDGLESSELKWFDTNATRVPSEKEEEDVWLKFGDGQICKDSEEHPWALVTHW